jgi:ceramide glucosyltransferase
MALYYLSLAIGFASVVGCGYLIVAIVLTDRFARKTLPPPPTRMPGVTILKPLHGAEPGLFENLASFCTQNYPGPVQLVFGVEDRRDEAIAIVTRLREAFPACDLELVVDETMHGLNRKVSNLVNMGKRAAHDVIVVADSDILVSPDYLSHVVGALTGSGTGAVTCLYHGVAATGGWARLAALGVNAHFLPSVIVGLGLGFARPCFGSTIALTRKALAEIGGFMGVADCLADDYAIGAALRARGHDVYVLPSTVAHLCAEASSRELWQHEVRWARTIRSIDPVGYAGSIVTHAFPLALLAAPIGIAAGAFAPATALGLAVAALGCRLALLWQVERAFGLPPQRYRLVPLRDLLSFTVFLASSFGRSASWKGRRYRFAADGSLIVARS